jgi:hypothetical protein
VTIKIEAGDTLLIIHQTRICAKCGKDAVTHVRIISPTKRDVTAFLCEKHTDELARQALDCGARIVKKGGGVDSKPSITR